MSRTRWCFQRDNSVWSRPHVSRHENHWSTIRLQLVWSGLGTEQGEWNNGYISPAIGMATRIDHHRADEVIAELLCQPGEVSGVRGFHGVSQFDLDSEYLPIISFDDDVHRLGEHSPWESSPRDRLRR